VPNTEVNVTRRFDGAWERRDYRFTLGYAEVVHGLKHEVS